ncbi:hypothetical protein N1851_006247 [Merluccius polli]|uniref:Uncharacterized protein n=1 Tax=Merluccius polli TaxID=89951 RepID=A0AA47N663_MERPO|nr:hypothetical protein N1851_006247 [Merluccius polli]
MVQALVAALTQLKDSPGPEEKLFNEGVADGVFKNGTVTQTDQKFVHAFKAVREQYIQHLIDALKGRFPENDMDILNCFVHRARCGTSQQRPRSGAPRRSAIIP